MKTDTHPAYNAGATIVCACGASFPVGTTGKDLSIEICSQCHPFYTGNEKTLDAAGRVEKFKARSAASLAKKKSK